MEKRVWGTASMASGQNRHHSGTARRPCWAQLSLPWGAPRGARVAGRAIERNRHSYCDSDEQFQSLLKLLVAHQSRQRSSNLAAHANHRGQGSNITVYGSPTSGEPAFWVAQAAGSFSALQGT